MKITKPALVALAAAIALVAVAPAFSQGEFNQGQGTAVITVLPAKKGMAAPSVSSSQLNLKIDGKPTSIAAWTPLHNSNAPIQLIVMIDDAARSTIGTQLSDISHFIMTLPPTAAVALAYMDNGRANLVSPLSTNHAAVAQKVRLPNGMPDIAASPYFLPLGSGSSLAVFRSQSACS